MQTLTSALLFKSLFITLIISHTWARGDRALFSIEKKVYYTSEVNAIIATYQYLKCINVKMDNLSHIFDDDFVKLIKSPKIKQTKDGFEITSFNYQEVRSAIEMIKLIKGISIAKRRDRTVVNKSEKCRYNPQMEYNISYILGLNSYINDNIERGLVAGSTKNESIEVIVKDIKSIKARRFFNE